MSRVNYRKAPSSGSQRHAKLGKRPAVGKQKAAVAGWDTHQVGHGSVVDEVTHKTFINKSGNTENLTG